MQRIENYLKNVMDNGYELLIRDHITWPRDLLDSQKVELLDRARLYFEERDEFEKCIKLQNKIKELCTALPAKERRQRITRPRKQRNN
jgi:hypothetical protein